MNEQQATVFVVDDDASVRRALERLLIGVGYQVQTYPSATAYLAREPHDGVGCVLLDIHMPDMSGTALQLQLAEMQRDIPIVFLTAHGDIRTSVGAMKHGAVDFLTKPVDEQAVFSAIEEALMRHRRLLNERLSRSTIEKRVNALTRREYEVMRYVIGGARNKQIAGHLGISEKTVKAHRGQAMQKMAVKSVAELVRLCEAARIAPEQIR